MKKMLALLAVVFCAVLFCSCGGNEPGDVIKKLQKGLENKDVAAVKECFPAATPDELIKMLCTDDAAEKAKKEKVEIVKTEINGDTAKVTLKGEKGEETMELKKENGKWVLNMN